MEFRKANGNDVNKLVEIRRAFLQSALGSGGNEEFGEAIRAYLTEYLPKGDAVVWLAEDKGKIVSCAMLSLYTELPTLKNPTGKTACLHNVFTDPDYRRQGLAEKIVRNCIQSAREWGAGRVCLGATEAGKPLYEKLGFQIQENEMRLGIS